MNLQSGRAGADAGGKEGGGGRGGGREGRRRGAGEGFGRRGAGEAKGCDFVAHVLAFLLDGGVSGFAGVGELTLHALPEGGDGGGDGSLKHWREGR